MQRRTTKRRKGNGSESVEEKRGVETPREEGVRKEEKGKGMDRADPPIYF